MTSIEFKRRLEEIFAEAKLYEQSDAWIARQVERALHEFAHLDNE